MADVIPPRAPNLPVATVGYEPRYIDQFANILRLYFNTVDNAFAAALEQLRTGEFDSLTANNFYGGNFSGNSFSGNTLIGDIITAKIANLTAVNAGSVAGGNAVFNNLTASNSNASLFTGSGRQINFPHIAASDSGDQYADANDDPTIVTWDTLAEAAGFTLNVDNTATATYSGVYKIDYSLQFANTANAAHDVYVWLQVNGSNVVDSMTSFTLPARKSAGVPSYLCAYSSITFDIQAGQSIGLWWATDLAYNPVGPVDGVYMEHIPVQTTPYARPAAPSAIGSIVYVSAPYPPLTLVVPTGVSGVGKAGTVTVVTS